MNLDKCIKASGFNKEKIYKDMNMIEKYYDENKVKEDITEEEDEEEI